MEPPEKGGRILAVAVGRWVRSSDADPSGPGND